MSPDKKAILALTADNERLRGLLNESRESVFQDIEHMRGSGVYEPDIGATIALLHNIDMALADWATDQRHPGYVIGNHWLESAYERICAGEAEDDVLRDYDVVRVTNQPSVAVDNGWRETVMACGCIYRGVLTPFCPYHPATPVPTPAPQPSACNHFPGQSTCEWCGAVQPERCCLDYPRCDCNSPPEPDNAPALQPCGHPWKAQHDSKCILCSSPGVTP